MRPLSQQFWSNLYSQLKFGSRTNSRPALRTNRWIAAAESRTLLAGTAIATFSGGTLTIAGVDDLTQAGVLAGLNNQQITLTGGGSGTVTVAGVGTTVTGAGTFNGVTSIKIDMKLGNDTATLTNVSITSALSFLGGDGDNQLNINGGGTSRFASITITNGDGDDGFDVTGTGDLVVSGGIVINHGDGDGEAHFGNTAAADISIGSLKFTALDGNDELLVSSGNFTVAGTTQITTGQGDTVVDISPTNSLVLGGATTITTLHDFTSIAIGRFGTVGGKAVTISTGNGDSDTYLRGGFGGAVSITHGNGFDDSDFESLNIVGSLTVKNGAGGGDTDFHGSIRVEGSLSITNGAGSNEIGNSSSGWTSLTITSGLTISNGDGNSRSKLNPAGPISIGGSVSISGGNGDDEIFLEPDGDLAVGGSVTYSTGNGRADTSIAGLGNTTINGAVAMTNGTGDTEFDLFVTNGKTFQVKGTTAVTTGAGDDSIDIVVGSSANATMLLKSVNFNLGTGGTRVEFKGFGGTTTVDGTFTNKAGPGEHSLKVNVPITTKTATVNLLGVGHSSAAEIEVRKAWNVTGDLLVTTGEGSDNIDFQAPMTVSGKTTLTTGSGDDFIGFQLASSTTLTGLVSITTAAGDDFIRIDHSTLNNNLTINTGSGDDGVDFNTDTFRGTVTLTMGAGKDDVAVEQSGDGLVTRFEKAFTINADAGDDAIRLALTGDNNDFCQFLAGLTMNGGAGLDEAFFKNAALGGTRFNTFAVEFITSLIEVQI